MTSLVDLTDLDRRIWDEELDGFVSRQEFDVHILFDRDRSIRRDHL